MIKLPSIGSYLREFNHRWVHRAAALFYMHLYMTLIHTRRIDSLKRMLLRVHFILN